MVISLGLQWDQTQMARPIGLWDTVSKLQNFNVLFKWLLFLLLLLIMISSILCTKYCTLVPVAETAKTQFSFFSIVSFYTEYKDILLTVQLWIICVVSLKTYPSNLIPFNAILTRTEWNYYSFSKWVLITTLTFNQGNKEIDWEIKKYLHLLH